MRKIDTACSLMLYLDEAEYTVAALAADPDGRDLAPLFERSIASLEPVMKRERASRHAVVRAEAMVSVCNERLDTLTTRFAGVLGVEALQDRKSPTYRRFFREAPSQFIKRNLREQAERTRDQIVVECMSEPEGSALRAWGDPLLSAAKAALASLTARAKAQGESRTVANGSVAWKDDFNRLRATTHAELLKRAAERRKPRSWVESFFRSASSAAASASEEATPVPAPVPAPSPEG